MPRNWTPPLLCNGTKIWNCTCVCSTSIYITLCPRHSLTRNPCTIRTRCAHSGFACKMSPSSSSLARSVSRPRIAAPRLRTRATSSMTKKSDGGDDDYGPCKRRERYRRRDMKTAFSRFKADRSFQFFFGGRGGETR